MIHSFFEHAAVTFLFLTALAIYINKNAEKEERKKLIKSLRKAPSNFYHNVRVIYSKIKAKGENC